ncbi:hypothetical protein [Haloplanus sp.]|nr:hypothetical protein [Haloplanus sp.]
MTRDLLEGVAESADDPPRHVPDDDGQPVGPRLDRRLEGVRG